MPLVLWAQQSVNDAQDAFAIFMTRGHCWLLFILVSAISAGTFDCWPTLQLRCARCKTYFFSMLNLMKLAQSSSLGRFLSVEVLLFLSAISSTSVSWRFAKGAVQVEQRSAV